MKELSQSAKIVRTESETSRKDSSAKQILMQRDVLARIVKHTCPEFKDIPYEDIATKYIESVTDKEPIFPVSESDAIEGLSTESAPHGEAKVNFDVFFKVTLPENAQTKRNYHLYVDCEPQGKLHPGYSLTKRAVYYAARLLSKQLVSVSDPKEYDKLQKVCSVWICFGDDASKNDAGSIAKISLKAETIVGKFRFDENDTHLADVVFVILDPADVDSEFIGFLGVLFNPGLSADERIDGLNRHGICVTEETERRVRQMGGIYEQHEIHGYGKAQAEIVSFMRKSGKSDETISRETGISLAVVSSIPREVTGS